MSLRRPSAPPWLAALAVAAATSAMAQPATPPADFAICAACHEIKPGGVSLGPSLFGVAGRKAGSLADYDYSPAMKSWGMDWTPENLAAFILDPAKTVPNNKMDYSGASDAATAKAIADYLATLKP
jgi:cytochrome c